MTNRFIIDEKIPFKASIHLKEGKYKSYANGNFTGFSRLNSIILNENNTNTGDIMQAYIFDKEGLCISKRAFLKLQIEEKELSKVIFEFCKIIQNRTEFVSNNQEQIFSLHQNKLKIYFLKQPQCLIVGVFKPTAKSSYCKMLLNFFHTSFINFCQNELKNIKNVYNHLKSKGESLNSTSAQSEHENYFILENFNDIFSTSDFFNQKNISNYSHLILYHKCYFKYLEKFMLQKFKLMIEKKK